MLIEDEVEAVPRATEADELNLALAVLDAARAEPPPSAATYARAASALMRANRAEEAESLLARAPLGTMADVGVMWEWAWVAYHRRDFDTAITRWQIFQIMFPDNPLGYSGLAVSLRERNHLIAAEKILLMAVQRFPDAASPAIEHAMLATLREDWAEAVRRWTALRERFPDEVRGYAEGAKALLRSGQVAAAEAVLQDAMARFADERSLLVQHAEVAQAQQDWTLAASRWEAALARDPDNQVTGHKLAVARMRVAETASAGAPNAAPVRFEGADPAVPEAERSAMLDLMMGFESLGSVRVGCEFGGVQRRFGAEPLGLLRWAEIHPDKLIDALSVEFEGVGLGANTIMYPFDDKPDAEYLTADTRFGLVSHTFASVAEHDREQFYKGVCQRLVFLRRKLLDDLAEARKIFVYKIDGVDMPDAEVTRLHAALCRFGRNTLLCVRLAQPNNPDGLVERIAPRLYIGYVGRFANGSEQPLPSWLTICRTAARMRQEDTA